MSGFLPGKASSTAAARVPADRAGESSILAASAVAGFTMRHPAPASVTPAAPSTVRRVIIGILRQRPARAPPSSDHIVLFLKHAKTPSLRQPAKKYSSAEPRRGLIRRWPGTAFPLPYLTISLATIAARFELATPARSRPLRARGSSW